MAGEDPNSVDDQQRNALMLALENRSAEEIKAILFPPFEPEHPENWKKVDLFHVDDVGRTALFYAVERGDEKILWILLEAYMGTGLCFQRGALLEIRDHSGRTAEDLAQEKGYMEIRDILQRERHRIDYFE